MAQMELQLLPFFPLTFSQVLQLNHLARVASLVLLRSLIFLYIIHYKSLPTCSWIVVVDSLP